MEKLWEREMSKILDFIISGEAFIGILICVIIICALIYLGFKNKAKNDSDPTKW